MIAYGIFVTERRAAFAFGFRFPGCPPRLRLVGSPDVTGLSYAKRNSIHVLRFVNDQMNRPAGVAAPEPKLINRTSVELLRGCSVPPS